MAVRNDLASSEGRVAQNLVRIYRALGGGWSLEDEEAAEGAENSGEQQGDTPEAGSPDTDPQTGTE